MLSYDVWRWLSSKVHVKVVMLTYDHPQVLANAARKQFRLIQMKVMVLGMMQGGTTWHLVEASNQLSSATEQRA
jgi:hypothetical protein